MEPFASNGLLQIIADLLWLKSGVWNALPASPFAFPCLPRDIRMKLWDLRRAAQKHSAFEMQAGIRWPICFRRTISLPGRQATMSNHTSQFTEPAYLVHPPGCGAWISPPKSGLTLLCMCLPGQSRPQGTVPSSWPWSPSACQTPSRRQGTTDPGELWEQRRLAEAISNPECSGQLPRLCSDFWCSLESSHYITERSTIKYTLFLTF